MEKITVTKEGLKKLTDELDYLKSVKRKEVTEAIRVALSFGDLSENSEYDEAKTEQGKVEGRIAELEELIRTAHLISEEETNSGKVGVGSTVKILRKSDGKELEYKIVGSTEASPLEGKISDQSPIGTALLGAAVGEVVKAEIPTGTLEFEILEIIK